MEPNETNPTNGTDAGSAEGSSSGGVAASVVGTPAPSNGGGTGNRSGNNGGGTATGVSWDVNSWDGKPESIHETYRPFYERVNSEWESKYKAVEDDARLYKDIVTGLGDDPRVTEANTKMAELQKKYDELASQQQNGNLTQKQALEKAEKIEKAYNDLLDKQAQQAVTSFKEKHKDIVGDPVKRQELIDLIDTGWDEEAAAMLVGKTSQVRERAIAIVTEHQLRGSGHRLAVSQAIGEQSPANISAPGALLTAGANGTVNPVRTKDHNIRNSSREDARMTAARLALVSSRSR